MILGRALLRQRGHLKKENDGRRSVMVGNEPDISASISDGGRTPVVVISTTEGLIEANQKKVALVLDALLGSNVTSSRESYDTIFGSGVMVTMPFPEIGNLIGKNEIRKSTLSDIPFTLVRGIDPEKECRTIVLNPQSFSTQMLGLYTQK